MFSFTKHTFNIEMLKKWRNISTYKIKGHYICMCSIYLSSKEHNKITLHENKFWFNLKIKCLVQNLKMRTLSAVIVC